MKLFLIAVALVGVTVASHDSQIVDALMNDLDDVIEDGWDRQFRMQAIKYLKDHKLQSLCSDEDAYLQATFTFYAAFNLPKLPSLCRTSRAIGAVIVANGVDGQRQFATAYTTFFDAVIANGDFPSLCEYSLGRINIRQILPNVIFHAVAAVSSYNIELLASDYSCAVITSLDTGADALKEVEKFLRHNLGQGDDCVTINIYLALVRSIYGECDPNIGTYMVAVRTIAFQILFPQCNLPPLPAGFKTIDTSKIRM